MGGEKGSGAFGTQHASDRSGNGLPTPLRLLIVGVGSIGERHLRCFQATGRARVSVCELDAALRERIDREYAVEHAYAGLDQALADEHDAAVIAVPAHLHISVAAALAAAGMHLLIEKPLSTSFDGIDSLVETVRKAGLVVAVAYVMRAYPALAAMKSAIASGRFGRPVQMVTVAGQHFPTYRPAYRDIYYKDRATGGGAIQDALTHLLNAGEWLAGPADRVVADAAHRVLDGVELEDTVNVLARHGDVLASYSLNQHQAPNETTITVVCERGTARFEAHRSGWRWLTQPGEPWHEEPFGDLERDTPFIVQANAFIDAVQREAEPLCSLEEGSRTLKTMLAVLKSADERSGWQ